MLVTNFDIVVMDKVIEFQFKFNSFAVERRSKPIYSVNFHPTLFNVFATVRSNSVSVYELSDGLKLTQGYLDNDVEDEFYSCCWAGSLLVVAGVRGIIKCINYETFELQSALFGHGNSINALKEHPIDDYLMFSVSVDESIRLWNLKTSVCIAVFAGEKGHRYAVLSLDVHPLGHCFASSGMDTK